MLKYEIAIQHINTIILLLSFVAFFTLAERKGMASIQRRKGPNVVGVLGLTQPLADGMKASLKELILPLRAFPLLFFLGPVFVFTLSLMGWSVVPLSIFAYISSIELAILYSFIASGLTVYGLILAGWSSNSRYAFLGSIRATAQMVSYELILGTVNLFIAFLAGSYSYLDIVGSQHSVWFFFPLFPIFIIYCIVMLAETNRTPFDLAEAEAELVAGYNVEYSSIMFAMFFLGEYANMALLSLICVLYFFGGWFFFGWSAVIFVVIKVLFFCFFFVWIRATLPRYRYDQLMEFGWKHLLPFVFGLFIFFVSIFLLFDLKSSASLYSTTFQDLLVYVYMIQQPTFVYDISILNACLNEFADDYELDWWDFYDLVCSYTPQSADIELFNGFVNEILCTETIEFAFTDLEVFLNALFDRSTRQWESIVLFNAAVTEVLHTGSTDFESTELEVVLNTLFDNSAYQWESMLLFDVGVTEALRTGVTSFEPTDLEVALHTLFDNSAYQWESIALFDAVVTEALRAGATDFESIELEVVLNTLFDNSAYQWESMLLFDAAVTEALRAGAIDFEATDLEAYLTALFDKSARQWESIALFDAAVTEALRTGATDFESIELEVVLNTLFDNSAYQWESMLLFDAAVTEALRTGATDFESTNLEVVLNALLDGAEKATEAGNNFKRFNAFIETAVHTGTSGFRSNDAFLNALVDHYAVERAEKAKNAGQPWLHLLVATRESGFFDLLLNPHLSQFQVQYWSCIFQESRLIEIAPTEQFFVHDSAGILFKSNSTATSRYICCLMDCMVEQDQQKGWCLLDPEAYDLHQCSCSCVEKP